MGRPLRKVGGRESPERFKRGLESSLRHCPLSEAVVVLRESWRREEEEEEFVVLLGMAMACVL